MGAKRKTRERFEISEKSQPKSIENGMADLFSMIIVIIYFGTQKIVMKEV